MLKQVTVKDFKGVPYLETSQLMQTCKGAIKFSSTKPTVIVGPNGAGKSALLTSLALRFLAYFTGESSFDDNYVGGNDCKAWWTKTRDWGNDYVYLKGLDCKTDNAPVLYYRPGHIPGNEPDVVHALMMGYSKGARNYAEAVEKKSSGQGNQAMLAKVLAALDGTGAPLKYLHTNWRYQKEAVELSGRGWYGDYDYQAEVLKASYKPEASAIPLVLMDEPEQSLDARAEAKLWGAIASADCSKVQVIVATHSLYPLMYPKKFNLVEAEPGFIKDVLSLMPS